ncbi:MAG TPA: hypothetical protein VF841_01675, partial [Anaeromyxobacter sp.]
MTRSSFETRIRRLALLAAGLSLAFASGCGGQDASAGPKRSRTARATTTTTTAGGLPQCTGTDVHQTHLSKFACNVCHPAGAQYGFAVPHVFPRGTTTAGGTLVLATAAAPTTCTVACHYPMGGAAKSITWNTPGPLDCTTCHDTATTLSPAHPTVSPTAPRSDCLACHDMSTHAIGDGTVVLVKHVAGWMDTSSSSFHAASAIRGLAACQQCHAADLSGGFTGYSCAQCHDTIDASGAPVRWATNCTMCHGGTNDQTGAPPKTIWGYASDAIRTGAHASHLAGSAIAAPFDCAVCHTKPADALAQGHIDNVAATDVPMATVALTGIAAIGVPNAAWDRAGATCATYCHGATLTGGSNTSPVWTTLDGSQAACGTCHGVPPPAPHPTVASDLTLCAPCHSQTVSTAGAIIPASAGGKHLDGIIEAQGHPAEWMDTTSAGFHAYSADLGLTPCESCHGQDLSGGTANVACGKCHDQNLPVGVASWKTNCTMCHGGTNDQTGAPPRTTWGQSSDPIRTGAH